MTSQETPDTLRSHYADHYSDQRQREWVELSALDKASNIIDSCTPVPHDTVLDVGTGTGAVLHKLEEAGFGTKLHAIEISDTGIQAVRARKWKSLVEVKEFDGYHIPYPNDRFDLAILSHVVEHVEHPRLLLYEVMRVARYVYVEVPLEYMLTNPRRRRRFELDSTGHINFYDPNQIRLLLETCNLKVLSLKIRHFRSEAYTFHRGRRGLFNYAIKETLYRINPRFASRFFNYFCSVLCERAGEPGPMGTAPPKPASH